MIIGNSQGEKGLKSLKENIIMKLNKNFQRSSGGKGGGGVVGGDYIRSSEPKHTPYISRKPL